VEVVEDATVVVGEGGIVVVVVELVVVVVVVVDAFGVTRTLPLPVTVASPTTTSMRGIQSPPGASGLIQNRP
jgi:hypothetical protein